MGLFLIQLQCSLRSSLVLREDALECATAWALQSVGCKTHSCLVIMFDCNHPFSGKGREPSQIPKRVSKDCLATDLCTRFVPLQRVWQASGNSRGEDPLGPEMTAPSMEDMNKEIIEDVVERTLSEIKLKSGATALTLYNRQVRHWWTPGRCWPHRP